MLTLLAAVTLIPATYNFTPEQKLSYNVQVKFDGFLPVFGGTEGTADIDLTMAVNGLAGSEGNQKAQGELTAVKVKFKEATLPFDLDSVKTFFPKTTVGFTPQGKVVASDAPDVQLPIRLPGLDVKRFPELTYLPVELPAEGLEVGKEWTFTKAFSDGEVSYKAKVSAIEGQNATIDITIAQTYQNFENEAKEVVKAEADAVANVTTELKGGGKVVFDTKLGAARSVDVETNATSIALDLKTNEKSERKLKTTLKVALAK